MLAENFDRSLRAMAHRTPLRPFTVELVSGQPMEGGHPEALVYRNRVAVCFSPEGGSQERRYGELHRRGREVP